MNINWLEDLLTLYTADSLTEAARRRNVSQPAFSRRIQMLEAWLGIELIDRRRKPATLTSVAREQETAIRAVVGGIYEFRAAARAQSKGESQIAIAAQHSLSSQPLLSLLRKRSGNAAQPTFRLTTGDRQECMAQLLRGDVDILYCYEDMSVLDMIPPAIAKTITIGHDELVAVGAPSLVGSIQMSGGKPKPLPLIIYPRESFFGGLLWQVILTDLMAAADVEVVCVTAFAQGALDLAVAGTGFVWLPRRMVEEAFRSRLLQQVDFLKEPIPLKIVAAIGRRSVPHLSSLMRHMAL